MFAPAKINVSADRQRRGAPERSSGRPALSAVCAGWTALLPVPVPSQEQLKPTAEIAPSGPFERPPHQPVAPVGLIAPPGLVPLRSKRVPFRPLGRPLTLGCKLGIMPALPHRILRVLRHRLAREETLVGGTYVVTVQSARCRSGPLLTLRPCPSDHAPAARHQLSRRRRAFPSAVSGARLPQPSRCSTPPSHGAARHRRSPRARPGR